MRVIVSGGGYYNGISVFQGDFGGSGGRFFGWRRRSARGLIRGGAISERLREICKRRFYDRREVISFRVVCKKVSQ